MLRRRLVILSNQFKPCMLPSTTPSVAAMSTSAAGSESKTTSYTVADVKHQPPNPPTSTSGFFYLRIKDVAAPSKDAQSLPLNQQPDAATLEYEVKNDGKTFDLTHTIVPVAFRGKGAAALLCDAAFAYMRTNKLTAIPTCSYIANTYLKSPKGAANADLIQK